MLRRSFAHAFCVPKKSCGEVFSKKRNAYVDLYWSQYMKRKRVGLWIAVSIVACDQDNVKNVYFSVPVNIA